MTKVEKNRVIRTDIINLDKIITWISPTALGKKMPAIRHCYTSKDAFFIRPSYMDIHLFYAAYSDRAIANFFTSVRD